MEDCRKAMLESISVMADSCDFSMYKLYSMRVIFKDGYFEDIDDVFSIGSTENIEVFHFDGYEQKVFEVSNVEYIETVTIRQSKQNIFKRFYKWHHYGITLTLLLILSAMLCMVTVGVWFLEII